MPQAKKDHYKDSIDSVKQRLMMEYPHWDAGSIDEHYQAMKKVLLISLGQNSKEASTSETHDG